MQLMYEKAGAVTPDSRFKPEWFNTNSDTAINKWRKEYPLFWYQYYYPPVWESEGSIALGQLLVAGEITPEEAAAKWQEIADKNRRENPSSSRITRSGSSRPRCSASKPLDSLSGLPEKIDRLFLGSPCFESTAVQIMAILNATLKRGPRDDSRSFQSKNTRLISIFLLR